MSKYTITIGRKTYEHLDVTVEADTEQEAIDKAISKAIVNCNHEGWDGDDCDYYETGVYPNTETGV